MDMNRARVLLLGGLLTAALMAPAMPAQADSKEHFEHHENPGKHLGWDKTKGKKFDEHDRRYYRHPEPRVFHRDVRYDRWHHDRHYDRRPEPRFYHGDTRYNDRGHQNKPEVRRNHRNEHNASKQVSSNQVGSRTSKSEIMKTPQGSQSASTQTHSEPVSTSAKTKRSSTPSTTNWLIRTNPKYLVFCFHREPSALTDGSRWSGEPKLWQISRDVRIVDWNAIGQVLLHPNQCLVGDKAVAAILNNTQSLPSNGLGMKPV
jgi:hypothetical protein